MHGLVSSGSWGEWQAKSRPNGGSNGDVRSRSSQRRARVLPAGSRRRVPLPSSSCFGSTGIMPASTAGVSLGYDGWRRRNFPLVAPVLDQFPGGRFDRWVKGVSPSLVRSVARCRSSRTEAPEVVWQYRAAASKCEIQNDISQFGCYYWLTANNHK